MISIICPSFNSSKTINDTIDSILAQTGKKFKFEVIFVDDGSTDNTVDLIKKSMKKFSLYGVDSYIYVSSHKGPGSARNLGIKKANYEYIAFIDSDDIWYEKKINICGKSIINNPDSNIFIHDENYIRDNKKNSIIINGIFKNSLVSSLYNCNCLSTSAIVIKKSLIELYGGFDEKLMSSQDYDLWLRLSPYLVLYKINEVLGEYREIDGSITSKFYLYRIFDQLVIAHRYRSYVSVNKYFYKLIKIFISKQWLYGIKNIILRRKGHNY